MSPSDIRRIPDGQNTPLTSADNKRRVIPVRSLNSRQTEPGSSALFTVRSIRELTAGGDLVQDIHRHDFYFILIVEHGTGSHEIDFSSCPVQARSVHLVRPGQVHRLSLKQGAGGFLIEFDPSFYRPPTIAGRRRLQKTVHKQSHRFNQVRFLKILTLLDLILRDQRERDAGCKEYAAAGLDMLFVELDRESGDNAGPTDHAGTYRQERLEEFLDLLETHVLRHKSAGYYAELMHLSRFQLNAITKASLGATVSTLISRQILLEAKRRLLATSIRVNELASRLGYDDPSYFIRFFRKRTGLTPEAYRERLK